MEPVDGAVTITRVQKIAAGAAILLVSAVVAWLAACAFDPARRAGLVGEPPVRSETGP
jgi:hypothetical protein